MDVLSLFLGLVHGGLNSLASYLAAHVLLCLLPAFFIAGGMSALIPRESIMRFLGRNAPRYVSYPASALAGSLLAVCSCTIVPLFAGIYKKGAGLGPAITFLFFAPAANILALAYTGVAIGADLAVARLILSLLFGIGIGMIMALIFSKEDASRDSSVDDAFNQQNQMRPVRTIFILLMVALLISGTLKLDFLSNAFTQITLPIPGTNIFQQTLTTLIPFNPDKGEEGVSVQGLVLILLLGLMALFAWKGFENIHHGINKFTIASFVVLVFTLLIGATRFVPQPHGLEIHLTGRLVAVGIFLLVIGVIAKRYLKKDEITDWIWESWRFMKQIFPLLLVGVFAVGVIRQLIRPEWIEFLAGENTILGNIAGVVFGVFMYFPTLVEVPIAKMFLNLGMHRGPLLAYLMADPELSLQSILITATIIGKTKVWVYVGWVALFSTLAGLIYGMYIDGTSIASILAILLTILVVLAGLLGWVSHRR